MIKRWFIKDPDRAMLDILVRELKISPIIARLLINRNISTPMDADIFLNGGVSNLHDPYMLKGMDRAVARIKRALSANEKILVYGDYDVDGLTSVALLASVLRSLSGDVSEYIPNRMEEGYGLNLDACRFASKKNITLLISVDCGINAKDEIAFLKRSGIDTIVIDHHEPQDGQLPEAYAIIDPFQADCSYPFKHLAGVGLAFKIIQALLNRPVKDIEDLLDLVALGTVSDVAPQLGENRIFTKYGLSILNRTKRPGLKALIRVSGLKGKDISAGHIGYILGPRINASGRVGSPKVALKLLLTDNEREAEELAGILDRENKNRQKIESNILKEAVEKVNSEVNFKEHRAIVLSDTNWHPGVIGIVASRLVEKFYRPTAIISVKDGTGRGSARSISNFNLFDAISRCDRHLIEFGGHEAACGFRIEKSKIEEFKSLFNKIVKKLLHPEDLLPKLNADIDMPLNRLSEGLIREIDMLAPHGPENPAPLFISRGVTLKNAPKNIGRRGIKFWVTDNKITCEALAFGVSDTFYAILKEGRVDLAYSPSLNTYKGLRSIKLDLKDIKASERLS